MASNLNLDFNILSLEYGQIVKEEKEFYSEEEEPYSEEENAVESILPVASNEMPDTIGIPKIGDDSLIGWWAALSIISLLGISATVCNLIITRKKQKK